MMNLLKLALFVVISFAAMTTHAAAAGIPIPNVPTQDIPTVADEQKPLLTYYYRAIARRSNTSVCKAFTLTIQDRFFGDPLTMTACAATVRRWGLRKSTWRSIKIVHQTVRQRSKKTATWKVTLRYKQRGKIKTFHESLSLRKYGGSWVLSKIPNSLYKATHKRRRPMTFAPYTSVELLTGDRQAESPYRNCEEGPAQMALDTFDDMSTLGSNPPVYWQSPFDIRWTAAHGGAKGICLFLQNNVREWNTRNTSITIHVEGENGTSADYKVIYVNWVFYTAQKINGVWSNAKPNIHILDGDFVDVIDISAKALPTGFNPERFSWSVTNLLKDKSKTGTDVYPDNGLASYDSSLGEIVVNTPPNSPESYTWGDNGLNKKPSPSS